MAWVRIRVSTSIAGVAFAVSAATGCGDGEEPARLTTTITTTSELPSDPAAATTTDEVQGAHNGGEDQETVAESKPVEIPDVLEAVLTGAADPALICDQLATENYIRTAYGAREGCIAAQKPGALAGSLDSVHVNSSGGDRASATVVPEGGPYDGVELDVELVRDGEGWRVDSLLADIPAGP